ncbi:hypothetical protein BpHYR1_031195 [Brachionus plicatilis]|uniref:Uncharacterized protein n=1 Tax=Brachionus plicatilis TaxID=10195 RepID=A0A3M7R8S8_BRAPC|nr:hypothetical protein BpHYR1_031195 [Brachionus plicatilis]
MIITSMNSYLWESALKTCRSSPFDQLEHQRLNNVSLDNTHGWFEVALFSPNTMDPLISSFIK